MPASTTRIPRFQALSGSIPCYTELRTLIHSPTSTPRDTRNPYVGRPNLPMRKSCGNTILLDAGKLNLIGQVYQAKPGRENSSRPTKPCGGPRMNPSLNGGNPPRPIRHFRMAEHCTPD